MEVENITSKTPMCFTRIMASKNKYSFHTHQNKME
jgi:hypothetical protein